MEGANEFCSVFKKAEQVGRLYLLPSHHARGETFRVYVLPEGVKVRENGGTNPPLNKNAVEVYGVVSGNPGWDEKYGWLHFGKWQEDFFKIAKERRADLEREKEKQDKYVKEKESKDKKRVNDLLGSY